jgi:hypothetical protein
VRFKLDENLPVELLDDLRAAGHEADVLRDEGLTGAADDVVLALVRRENRVLLTLDKGIADVRAHPPEAHAGIVLVPTPGHGSWYHSLVRTATPGISPRPGADRPVAGDHRPGSAPEVGTGSPSSGPREQQRRLSFQRSG